MLKVVVQPEKPTRSWLYTTAVQQDEVGSLTKQHPGMRPHLASIYADAYPRADRSAAAETGIPETRFPADNPWTLYEALAYMPPEPPPRGRKVTRKR